MYTLSMMKYISSLCYALETRLMKLRSFAQILYLRQKHVLVTLGEVRYLYQCYDKANRYSYSTNLSGGSNSYCIIVVLRIISAVVV